MIRSYITLEISVRCDVPDHVYERDKKLPGMTEEDIWHDYAVGVFSRRKQVRHGLADDDWIDLDATLISHHLEDDPEDI